MTPQERLRRAIDQEHSRLGADVPHDREAAILALVRARDRLLSRPDREPQPDLIAGRRLTDAGGNTALRLCLEATGADATGAPAVPDGGWDGWAERFLGWCGQVAEAELVLGHCQTGFMRLVENGSGTFDAWVATKWPPASWRERADIDWWAAWLAKSHEPKVSALDSARPDPEGSDPGSDVFYRRRADAYLKTMAYQLGYPPDAAIGGCTIQTYGDVLRLLIAWALRERDRGEAVAPQSEHHLIASLAAALGIEPALASRAVAAFTLDRENAAWHAAVPDVAAAPLVRVGPDRLVASLYGLTTEPFFFLTRELKRSAAPEYHNSAYLREDVFRQDLYAVFADKRFVTSPGRIALRREGGDVRTDVDAAVFDRKTGALGVFELKSQDPFARSAAEQARQRDNLLYANRQLSGVLSWLNRHGGDALLGRFDAQTAKRFRVQKVYPFVLGRYLAHAGDGQEPDRRAAWGTWPQLLRLLDGQPAGANPIASLFTRLTKDAPGLLQPAAAPAREIAIGGARLVVHPSYAAFQARTAGESERRQGSSASVGRR